MSLWYYDFYGKPARVTTDDEETPDSCEVYDREQGVLVRRDDLTLDVIDSDGSDLISREAFEELMEKVRTEGGK